MKTWTMPKVEIEAFAGDECVSACESIVDNSKRYASDLVHPSSSHSSGLEVDGDRTGWDDHWLNNDGFEMWYGQLSISAASGYDGQNLKGWHLDKPVFVRVKSNITSGSFDDTTLFRYLGNFDIQVRESHTYLYTVGDHSSPVTRNRS